MQFSILLFELRRRMRNPLTYIYYLIFALFGFIGLWRGSLGKGLLARLTSAGRGNIEADAPYALYYYITLLSTFSLLIAMAWFANAACRDYRYKTHHLFFSYPIGKLSYLGGRFAGPLAGMLFVVSGVVCGGIAAAVSPLTDPNGIGDLHIIAFIHPYIVSVLPNLFLAGSLFFSITLLSRQFNSALAGMAGIMVLHLAAMGLAQTDAKTLAALLDPSGLVATRQIYGYWSIAQKNELLIPMAGPLLANRLVWTAIATMICVFAYRRFNFLLPEASSSGGCRELADRDSRSDFPAEPDLLSARDE